MRANCQRSSRAPVTGRPGDETPGKLTLARVNPLDHAQAIKQLFVAHERPEFPDYFDRTYPDVVADGGASWVGWDEQGRLSAHIAQLPREFVFNGRRVQGALLANLMVADEHRRFWPALALARRVVEDLTQAGSTDFIYADPNDLARPVLLGAGLQEIGVLHRCVLPLTDRRQGVALGLRVYHLFQRLRAMPLMAIERLAAEPDGVADRIPAGDQGALRPIRRASLYRSRLPGYPSATDRWFTFRRRGRDATPVGHALVRGPDHDGVAVVCALEWAPLTHVHSLIVTLGHCLARAGATRLELGIMDGSHGAKAARRAGFLPRAESVSVLAHPVTALGHEVIAARGDWQMLALDLDR